MPRTWSSHGLGRPLTVPKLRSVPSGRRWRLARGTSISYTILAKLSRGRRTTPDHKTATTIADTNRRQNKYSVPISSEFTPCTSPQSPKRTRICPEFSRNGLCETNDPQCECKNNKVPMPSMLLAKAASMPKVERIRVWYRRMPFLHTSPDPCPRGVQVIHSTIPDLVNILLLSLG